MLEPDQSWTKCSTSFTLPYIVYMLDKYSIHHNVTIVSKPSTVLYTKSGREEVGKNGVRASTTTISSLSSLA